MRSAPRTVENRWEMNSAVRARSASRRVANSSCSARGSSDGARLVQDHQRGVAVEGAGQGHALPLAARQVGAAGEQAGQHGVEAVRERVEHRLRAGRGRRGPHPRRLGRAVDPAERDVVRGRQRVVDEVLEHDGDALAQARRPERRHVLSVPQHASLVGLVEARQQLGQGGLSGAVLADQGDDLPGAQLDVDALERVAVCARVAEPDVLDLHQVEPLRRLASLVLVDRGLAEERGTGGGRPGRAPTRRSTAHRGTAPAPDVANRRMATIAAPASATPISPRSIRATSAIRVPPSTMAEPSWPTRLSSPRRSTWRPEIVQVGGVQRVEPRGEPAREAERAHLLGLVPSGLEQREVAAQPHGRRLPDREVELEPRLPAAGDQEREHLRPRPGAAGRER